jgi:cell division protease FtsH
VCEWGMSDTLGPVTFGKEDRQVFLGRELGHTKDYSESTAVLIDKEIRTLVEQASERAEKLLSDNLDKLHLLAETLLERETLTGDDLDELFGRSPSPRAAAERSDKSDAGTPGGTSNPDEDDAEPHDQNTTAPSGADGG